MATAKTKGSGGEREAADLLTSWGRLAGFKLTIERNLEQSRRGGADLDGVPMLTIEIKRQEQLNINTWWQQTVRAATINREFPLLIYRQNRQKWVFVTLLGLGSSVIRVSMDQENARIWFANHLNTYCGALRFAPEAAKLALPANERPAQ